MNRYHTTELLSHIGPDLIFQRMKHLLQRAITHKRKACLHTLQSLRKYAIQWAGQIKSLGFT
jgi:hypothetical protein